MSEPPAHYAPKAFTCAECGQPFEADPAEEEAAGELERAFPNLAHAPRSAICQDCLERNVQ